MPAESVKITNLQDIDIKGKVRENKEGDRDQVTIVGFDFIGSSMPLNKILHAIENKVKVNVNFGHGVIIKDIYALSCRAKIEEDAKLGTRWQVTTAQFEYVGSLAPMDKILDFFTSREQLNVEFEMDQYVLVDIGTGEVTEKEQ